MPVLLERVLPGGCLQPATKFAHSDAGCIEIALVNNMPDAALESTERQFLELLDAAAEKISVRLRLFSLPDVPRSHAARAYLAGSYFDISKLWNAQLDGIIVTGTEPRAPSLRDEPYWAALTKLVDWAETKAVASVWSCLAAHAAVLHQDGIARRALANKCFGLFDCARVADHPLMDGMPPRVRIAHSRWNELPEEALRACRYTILTRSAEAGVDIFVKQGKSLSLYFQGHPEYDERALLREYRRDIGRYLRRERDSFPAMPQGYFDANAASVMAEFRERALVDRREELIASFPSAAVEGALTRVKGSPATRIYANWLSHVSSQKAQRLGSRARATAPRTRRVTAAVSAEGVG
jgi:homoserine O-succinyltransferase